MDVPDNELYELSRKVEMMSTPEAAKSCAEPLLEKFALCFLEFIAAIDIVSLYFAGTQASTLNSCI